MSAPNTNSTELFVLHEGTELEVLSQLDGWVEVRFPDGTVGFLPEGDVGMV